MESAGHPRNVTQCTKSVSSNSYDGPPRPSKREDSEESTGSEAHRTAESQGSRSLNTRLELRAWSMNKKRTLWTVLLALLCVPTSAVGIVLGYIVGCVIALVLRDILAPGALFGDN